MARLDSGWSSCDIQDYCWSHPRDYRELSDASQPRQDWSSSMTSLHLLLLSYDQLAIFCACQEHRLLALISQTHSLRFCSVILWPSSARERFCNSQEATCIQLQSWQHDRTHSQRERSSQVGLYSLKSQKEEYWSLNWHGSWKAVDCEPINCFLASTLLASQRVSNQRWLLHLYLL